MKPSEILSLLLLLLLPCLVEGSDKPNILFILADDMGWGDVSWADYPQIPTPNLEELRSKGVELTQFYTQAKCTPSRAALMTGRYPFKMGLQTHFVFTRTLNNTLDPSLKLTPAFLKDMGYATHIVGKWHLGFCTRNTTPTNRGFDTFFGSFGNVKNYFTQKVSGGYDWSWHHDGLYQTYWDANGTYNTFLVTSHTQKLLKDHFNDSATEASPIFIHVAYLAPHKPAQAPSKYVNDPECSGIDKNSKRRQFCGMMKALDEGIGNITDTLKELGILNDTLIIFASDNGGALGNGASNWPLRGTKQSVYEGGTRTRCIMHAPNFLQDTPRKYEGLVHMVDMLPTLYAAATGNADNLPSSLDGINLWNEIKNNNTITRKWMVYNIDYSRNISAIRLKNETHNFKLVYSAETHCKGWKYDPRPEEERDGRRQTYHCPADGYRLFNLQTNPEELEPDLVPDAALEYPHVKQLMVRKLNKFREDEVPIPVYSRLPHDGPGRPDNNNGAYGVGDCE